MKEHISYENFIEFYTLKGWTQGQLSKAIGVSQPTLSNYLTKGKPLPAVLIIRIREKLKLNAELVNWLLLDGEEPNRAKQEEKSEAEKIGLAIIEIVNQAKAI